MSGKRALIIAARIAALIARYETLVTSMES